MNADYLTADDFADPPVDVLTENGRATVSRAVWDRDTDVLADLQRKADEWRNLHPDLGDEG
ncbi:hypothetical protein AYJ66_06475 [Dietzia cinnamea]|nr:hypothetical protein AYJ66_06475 [Dietzia cinnamea]